MSVPFCSTLAGIEADDVAMPVEVLKWCLWCCRPVLPFLTPVVYAGIG